MRILLGIVVILVSTGCAVSSKPSESTIFRSQNVLQINSVFSDLKNGTRVYFQNSQRLDKPDIDSWQSFCSLYVYNSAEDANSKLAVLPGDFDIIRSATGIETVDLGTAPVLVASLEWARHDPPSFVLYKTTLYLKSQTQPGVQSLSCVQKVSTFGDYYLSESQIIDVLPDYFQFVGR